MSETIGIGKIDWTYCSFTTPDATEVMRIDRSGVTINKDFVLDDAAQHVIAALDSHIKAVVSAEREKAAKLCDHLLKEGGGTYGDAIRSMK
jgi:hypothetical protein